MSKSVVNINYENRDIEAALDEDGPVQVSQAEFDELVDEQLYEEHYGGDGSNGAFNSIHIKWIADGSTSLKETAARLRDYADYIEELDTDGWILSWPIENSHGELTKPDKVKELEEKVREELKECYEVV